MSEQRAEIGPTTSEAEKKKRAALRLVLAAVLYIAFQILLILIWLVCYLLGVGGLLIHLLLVLALLLALIGMVAGLVCMLRRR